VDTRERVWIRSDAGIGIGIGIGRVDVSHVSGVRSTIAPGRIGSKTDDARTNATNRRGRAWTTTGVRARRSSGTVTRTNERTNGWMDARSKIRVDFLPFAYG
jgi:hypothetical protein